MALDIRIAGRYRLGRKIGVCAKRPTWGVDAQASLVLTRPRPPAPWSPRPRTPPPPPHPTPTGGGSFGDIYLGER